MHEISVFRPKMPTNVFPTGFHPNDKLYSIAVLKECNFGLFVAGDLKNVKIGFLGVLGEIQPEKL